MLGKMDFLNFTSTNGYCRKCSENINHLCNKIINDEKYNKTFRELIFLKKKMERYNLRNLFETLTQIISSYLNFTNSSSLDIICLEINDDLIENSNILCNDCLNEIHKQKAFIYNYDIICVYYKSYIVSELFNYITEDNVLPILQKLFYNEKFDEQLKKKLFEFKGYTFGTCSPKSNTWKGSDYYFEKIYGFPIYFYEYNPITHNIDKIIDVPLEVYQKRKDIFLEDYICGHPMASDGWYKETLNEMESLGVF